MQTRNQAKAEQQHDRADWAERELADAKREVQMNREVRRACPES